MPNFPSAAFSALLKGVRKVQRNGIKPELKKKWVADAVVANDNIESELAKHAISVINEILEPNEFQLAEQLPVGPKNPDMNFYIHHNREELQAACKLFGIKGVNSRWKEDTCVGKLIAGGVSCNDDGTLSREYK